MRHYATFAAEDDKPLLSTIATRGYNASSTATTSFNTYDTEGRVASTTDGNGNQHIYTYGSGQTLITVKNAANITVQVWIQYQDAMDATPDTPMLRATAGRSITTTRPTL